jgi:hypothetical protein
MKHAGRHSQLWVRFVHFVKMTPNTAGFRDAGLCNLTGSLGRYFAAGSVSWRQRACVSIEARNMTVPAEHAYSNARPERCIINEDGT